MGGVRLEQLASARLVQRGHSAEATLKGEPRAVHTSLAPLLSAVEIDQVRSQ